MKSVSWVTKTSRHARLCGCQSKTFFEIPKLKNADLAVKEEIILDGQLCVVILSTAYAKTGYRVFHALQFLTAIGIDITSSW
jgi:hypothetical protein